MVRKGSANFLLANGHFLRLLASTPKYIRSIKVVEDVPPPPRAREFALSVVGHVRREYLLHIGKSSGRKQIGLRSRNPDERRKAQLQENKRIEKAMEKFD